MRKAYGHTSIMNSLIHRSVIAHCMQPNIPKQTRPNQINSQSLPLTYIIVPPKEYIKPYRYIYISKKHQRTHDSSYICCTAVNAHIYIPATSSLFYATLTTSSRSIAYIATVLVAQWSDECWSACARCSSYSRPRAEQPISPSPRAAVSCCLPCFLFFYTTTPAFCVSPTDNTLRRMWFTGLSYVGRIYNEADMWCAVEGFRIII